MDLTFVFDEIPIHTTVVLPYAKQFLQTLKHCKIRT